MAICGEFFKLSRDTDLFAYFQAHYTHFFPALVVRIRMPDLYHFQCRLIRKILARTNGVSHLQMGRQPPDLDGILTGECHGYDDYYNCGTCQPQSPAHGLARRPLEH